jgi:hypothetical protein
MAFRGFGVSKLLWDDASGRRAAKTRMAGFMAARGGAAVLPECLMTTREGSKMQNFGAHDRKC